MSGFKVVICGGGVAAVEALLRLRRLAGDAVAVTLVAPNEELVYRPLSVEEPFAGGGARRYPLARIATDLDAELVADELAWVDRHRRVLGTAGGRETEYDALLVAVGGRALEALPHATTFRDTTAGGAPLGIVQDVEGGWLRRLAFVLPDGPTWPLPIYELALMTAERARAVGADDVELTLVTAEPEPLAVFGRAASDAVGARLEAAGVAVLQSAWASVPEPGRLVVQPQGVVLEPERIVAVPRIAGPAIRGIPGTGAHGFIPIDGHCVVPGTDGRVFAAGDATTFPVKHGGVGAQQADVAAAGIAHLAGAAPAPAALHAEIHGTLLTGDSPLYVSARVVGGRAFDSEVHERPPWAGRKVVADELAPYLERMGAPARA